MRGFWLLVLLVGSMLGILAVFSCESHSPLTDCGDGDPDGSEQCDDSDSDDCDICHNDCTLNTGCGDDHICPPEQCDDGNSTVGDGCSPECMLDGGIGITSDLPDPSVVGETVTVTWVIVCGSAPTGTVTVTDGLGATCAETLPADSCELTPDSVGPRTLTASYSGDASCAAASDVDQHDVERAHTEITITSDDPDPSAPGQAVEVSWEVEVSAPGSGTPTGTVTVSGCGASSCSGPANGSCDITPPAAGSCTITASYAGNGDFNPSSDTASHKVVGPQPDCEDGLYDGQTSQGLGFSFNVEDTAVTRVCFEAQLSKPGCSSDLFCPTSSHVCIAIDLPSPQRGCVFPTLSPCADCPSTDSCRQVTGTFDHPNAAGTFGYSVRSTQILPNCYLSTEPDPLFWAATFVGDGPDCQCP